MKETKRKIPLNTINLACFLLSFFLFFLFISMELLCKCICALCQGRQGIRRCQGFFQAPVVELLWAGPFLFRRGIFHGSGWRFKRSPEAERWRSAHGPDLWHAFCGLLPNRELGIVYYRMGNLNEAKKLLEMSLSQYPSSKAQFYLDRVRKDMIKKMGEDIAPPKLSLDFKQDEFTTNADPVIIRGYAQDPNFVSAIAVGTTPSFLDGAQKDIRFEKSWHWFKAGMILT